MPQKYSITRQKIATKLVNRSFITFLPLLSVPTAVVLRDQIEWTILHLLQNTRDVLTANPEHHHLHPAKKQTAHNNRRPARNRRPTQRLKEHMQKEQDGKQCREQSRIECDAQRLHRVGKDTVERE